MRHVRINVTMIDAEIDLQKSRVRRGHTFRTGTKLQSTIFRWVNSRRMLVLLINLRESPATGGTDIIVSFTRNNTKVKGIR